MSAFKIPQILLVLAKEIFEWCLVAEYIIVLAQKNIYTQFLVSESIYMEKGFLEAKPHPPPPRSQRHLEISNKMESFPSYWYIVYMFVYTCTLDIWVRVYMSRDMTKPAKWLCAQRRLRSAWASAQSDQSLRCCPHEEALGP